MFPDSHEDLKQAEERQRILGEEQKQLENESKKVFFISICCFIFEAYLIGSY